MSYCHSGQSCPITHAQLAGGVSWPETLWPQVYACPVAVTAINRLMLAQVDAGLLGGARIVMEVFHSVEVSAEGRVWTFGYGGHSCLGLNVQQGRLVPTLLGVEVFEDCKIVTVATTIPLP